jgi:hypothetical protein
MKIVWGRSIGWNMSFNGIGRHIPAGFNPMEYTIITDGAGCYPWKEHFAWLPVKTITGLRAWGVKVYKRRVWIVWGTGFHMEPETQYATILELLTAEE